MATIEKSQLSEQEYNNLCCVYAAFVLHDGNKPLTEENIKKLISASSNKVNATFVKMFANAIKTVNIEELLSTMTVAASAAPVEQPSEKKGKGKAEKKEVKKEEKKEPEPEPEPEIGGFGGIFGDDDG